MKKFALLPLILLASCSHEPEDEPQSIAVPADFMGIVHAGERADAAREFALLDQLGAQWMLNDFSWSGIEPANDNWNWSWSDAYVANAGRYNKKNLAILDYSVGWIPDKAGKDKYIPATGIPYFVDYVKKTVERYDGAHGHGKVDAWCIWNEPNYSRFWEGTPEEFYALSNAAAVAIRETNPKAFIVGGAFYSLEGGAFVEGFFNRASDNLDVVAYHPYTISDAVPQTFLNFKNTAGKYKAKAGGSFADRVWVTEIGFPTNPGYGYAYATPEDAMPETVIRTLLGLTLSGAKRIFWYHLFDKAPQDQNIADSEDWFGLVKNDWTLKKGAAAYSVFAHHIPGTTHLPQFPLRGGMSQDITAAYFRGVKTHSLIIVNTSSARKYEVNVRLRGENRYSWNLASGQPVDIPEAYSSIIYQKNNRNKYPSVWFITWDDPAAIPPEVSASHRRS